MVVMELLDKNNYVWFFQVVYELLKPGGQIVFYESNPWNVMLKLRRSLSKLFGQRDSRQLLKRTQLYELISELGFIRVFTVYNDFVYAPLTPFLAWLLRNISILLENTPGIQTLAGSILIYAQKPSHLVERPQISLCSHKQLHKAISVVIPCYNEELILPYLANTLRSVEEKLGDRYRLEFLFVDDKSSDDTYQALQRLFGARANYRILRHANNLGVAGAIGTGVAAADVSSTPSSVSHWAPGSASVAVRTTTVPPPAATVCAPGSSVSASSSPETVRRQT